MKKWYILLFSILLLLGFVACGKNSASGMEKILWIAPPPFAFGEWVQSQKMIDDSVAFAQFCLAQAEEQNIRCLDAGRWGVTMAYDGVHFTEQGHRAVAEGLYKEICL